MTNRNVNFTFSYCYIPYPSSDFHFSSDIRLFGTSMEQYRNKQVK